MPPPNPIGCKRLWRTNTATRAPYMIRRGLTAVTKNLSVESRRLRDAALAAVGPWRDDSLDKEYTLSVKSAFIGIKYNRHRVQVAAKELVYTVAMLEDESLIQVFSSVSYHRGQMTFKLAPDAEKILKCNSREGFSTAPLPHLLALGTKMQERLYSFVISIRGLKRSVFTYEEIRKALNADTKVYKDRPYKLVERIKVTAKKLEERVGFKITVEKIQTCGAEAKLRFKVTEPPDGHEMIAPHELSYAAHKCRGQFGYGKARCARCGDPNETNPVCKQCAKDAARVEVFPKEPTRPPETTPIPWYTPMKRTPKKPSSGSALLNEACSYHESKEAKAEKLAAEAQRSSKRHKASSRKAKRNRKETGFAQKE